MQTNEARQRGWYYTAALKNRFITPMCRMAIAHLGAIHGLIIRPSRSDDGQAERGMHPKRCLLPRPLHTQIAYAGSPVSPQVYH